MYNVYSIKFCTTLRLLLQYTELGYSMSGLKKLFEKSDYTTGLMLPKSQFQVHYSSETSKPHKLLQTLVLATSCAIAIW
jgi:hypothetical protein